MLQKDYDALDQWLNVYGRNCDTWDTVTRMEALSWLRSLAEHAGWPAPDTSPPEQLPPRARDNRGLPGPRQGNKLRAPGW